MKYLFFDSSSQEIFAQIGTKSEFRTFRLNTQKNLVSRLPGFIEEILSEKKWKFSDLNLVSVCIGPGSLTGLRVGLGFFRAACHVMEKPIFGIDLFSWSRETLIVQGKTGEARLVIPAFLNHFFVKKVNLTVSSQKLGGNRKALEGAKRPTAGDEPREFFAMDGIMSRSPGWARATTSRGEGGRVPPFIEKLHLTDGGDLSIMKGMSTEFEKSSPELLIGNEESKNETPTLQKTPFPIENGIPVYGIRCDLTPLTLFGHEHQDTGTESLEPSSEALHKLLVSTYPPEVKFDNILQVKPFYVIPSQAELNFAKEVGKC